MTTTRHAGDVHTIFGIQSIITTIETLAGDHAPDIDIYEAESAYTEYLENLLPYGWTISGNEVYRHVDAEDIDTDQARQAVRDGNGFDITAYIVDDGTDDIEPEGDPADIGEDIRVHDVAKAEKMARNEDAAIHALHKMLEWQSAHDALTEAITSGAELSAREVIAMHTLVADREAIKAIREYRNTIG